MQAVAIISSCASSASALASLNPSIFVLAVTS